MPSHGALTIPAGLADLAHPDRTALLVYDMQAGICPQIADCARITAQSALAVAAARRAGMRVAYTRHLSLPRRWMGVTQMRTALAWQRTDDPEWVQPWFPRGSAALEIVPELAPEPEDAVFDKIAMSAFEGTPLALALRDCGLVGLAIVGIATEVGIEPTVRQATDLGFIPILLTDALGHGHAASAEAALALLRHAGETVFTDVAGFSAALAADRSA